MHQRRRLQGVAGRLLGHPRRRHAPKLVIHERQQFLQGPLLATPDGLKNQGRFTHGINLMKNRRWAILRFFFPIVMENTPVAIWQRPHFWHRQQFAAVQ